MLGRTAVRRLLPTLGRRAMSENSTLTPATSIIRFLDEDGVVRYGQPVRPDRMKPHTEFQYTPEESQRRVVDHALLLEQQDDGFEFGFVKRHNTPPGTPMPTISPKASILRRTGLPLFTRPIKHWGTLDSPIPVKITKLLSPIPTPPAIFAVGVNYHGSFTELGLDASQFMYPVVFMENPANVQNPFDPILIPKVARGECDYEVELAVVIGVSKNGKLCKDVSVENALDYVLGYTVANDVGARKWQGKKGGGQWSRAKSFDTFLPLGPVLVSPDVITDPQNLTLTTRLNGEKVQSASTKEMAWNVRNLISFLSQDTTLLPGTVILTGTPQGIGFVKHPPRYLRNGDKISVEIEKIGCLYNHVIEET